MATQNTSTPQLDSIHAEWAAANAAYDQATADLQAATSAAHDAKQRKEQARLALPVADRAAPLVGSAVNMTITSGSVILLTLTACLDAGILATLEGKDTPLFYPWNVIEDIQPA